MSVTFTTLPVSTGLITVPILLDAQTSDPLKMQILSFSYSNLGTGTFTIQFPQITNLVFCIATGGVFSTNLPTYSGNTATYTCTGIFSFPVFGYMLGIGF